jgi:competence protein ComEC
MIRWLPYTFIRIVLFFACGIIAGIYLPGMIAQPVALTLLVALIAAYLFYFIFFRLRHASFFNPGFIGLPAVLLAGYVHTTLQTAAHQPGHLLSITEPIRYYKAVITKYPEEKQRSWKAEAIIADVFTGTWQHKGGKIVLYFSKADFKEPCRYGDVLLIKGQPRLVEPPANPGEFNYRQFLAFRNIYHQHFLRSTDVKWIGSDPPGIFMHHAIRARMWADGTLKQFVRGKREQAIASALVLGVTDGLDNELLSAYAATGAMHVLAVSGLHISIIYMILVWLLRPVLRLRSGAWILAVVSLFVLWAYAFITGLSPSVLRAVTMFSFIALARPAGQNTNIYNTLAASAFCLLLFDPFLIMSVGFQLSYLAVLGIVYLQPRLYRLWEPRSRFWDEVWKITCVSVAAQIATFALGLLYFHQFPNYFLLSNLLVIPGAFVVLILGIAVLAASFISAAASALGFLLTWSIRLLNIVVFTMETFPFSVTDNIHISVAQCWLLMALIVAVILLVRYKRFYYSLVVFAFAALFAVLQWQHFSERINVQKITIYNVSGHSAIDLIDRGHAYFLADSALLHDAGKLQFHVQPNRLVSGVGKVFTGREQPFIERVRGGSVICWRRKIIVHLTHQDFLLPDDLRADWIVIGNNAVADITKLGARAKIILDSSNSYFYAERILAQAKKHHLDVYSVVHQGAFDVTVQYQGT